MIMFMLRMVKFSNYISLVRTFLMGRIWKLD